MLQELSDTARPVFDLAQSLDHGEAVGIVRTDRTLAIGQWFPAGQFQGRIPNLSDILAKRGFSAAADLYIPTEGVLDELGDEVLDTGRIVSPEFDDGLQYVPEQIATEASVIEPRCIHRYEGTHIFD
jgi:hypothetical protein